MPPNAANPNTATPETTTSGTAKDAIGTHTASMSDAQMPLSALILGLAGLLPFLGAVMVMQTNLQGYAATAATSLLVYGAVIVSFLGGVRWGVELCNHPAQPRWLTLTSSVVTSLIAWPAVLIGGVAGLLMLTIAFVFQYLVDARAVSQHQVVGWYRSLRLILTTVVVLCLTTGAMIGGG